MNWESDKLGQHGELTGCGELGENDELRESGEFGESSAMSSLSRPGWHHRHDCTACKEALLAWKEL